ncbi:MAG: hydrogenase iron-sulfur subunit [Syntrophobacterales bacterium]|nr:hydrogenase iron-sulfur subunit [Syntrophobacterales bacterium]
MEASKVIPTAPVAEFQPKILALVCTYCTYTAADMAGSARMQYPPTVRIVKYLCTGRIDILHILKAFEAGADAVMVSGCEAGSCHFLEGNLRARERVEYAKKLLAEIGLEPERLEMFEVAASDAPKWVMVVREMTERVKKLGPSPLHREGGSPAQVAAAVQRVVAQ